MKEKTIISISVILVLIATIIAFCSCDKAHANEVCFTPQENCQQLILNKINNAKYTIDVQAYSFSDKVIAADLIRAEARGVIVIVLVDKSQLYAHYSLVNKLSANKIIVKDDYKPRIAHNKVMIIDGKTVITGSYNFSYAAQHYNAENLLVITDAALVKRYIANFHYREKLSKYIPNKYY